MENIIIPSDTYNLFIEKYRMVHEEIIENIAHCNIQLDGLMHSESGFHADMISEKLDMMMEIWNQIKLPYLEVGFSQMESAVYEYLNAIQNEDRI
ncbi:MAG: hypothetical protein ACI4DK_04340 [Lachnospiraceae bacterium]